jgi:chromosome segregation ATPase
LVVRQEQSQPCADSDKSERCQLKRAVSAALDEIEKLRFDLQRARDAIAAQEKTIRDAEAVLSAATREREASDKTIAAAQKVIDQQQGLITTYERAIGTLQTMVQMALNRVDVLEKKVDKANGRTAVLGIILTVAGVLVGLKR